MRYLVLLESLGIEVIFPSVNQSLISLSTLARPHQLTAYDAVYLDLAITRGVPLYTLDKNLQQAAKKLGVERIV